MDPSVYLFSLGCLFVLVLGGVIRIWRRRHVEQQSLSRYNAVRATGAVIPQTLHPVFDPNRCIGSGACTRACPQGSDVLGRIHQRGVLVDPSMCIGHGRCAAECPVGAIRLVFGTAERGVDIPHLRPTFETNIDGLYITGELGGMGLIANAVRQATEGMQNLRHALEGNALPTPTKPDEPVSDVIIVGAGPAGLTAALFATAHQMSYRLFDKEAVPGGAISSYPRRKLVMTHPMDLPLVGRVHRSEMTKEELLALWNSVVATHKIRLESGVAVDNIQKGSDGIFTVTGGGCSARGRAVMLAVGRRGTPRRLGIPGEDGPNVFYGMREPEAHAGRRVLVVGGGDSAVEAACTLAAETDATVALSYRKERFTRVKGPNVERFFALVAKGRIESLFSSQLRQIAAGQVEMLVNGVPRTIAADDVIVLIGGELPTALLARVGVHLERHFGEETQAHRNRVGLDVFQQIRAQAHSVGLKNFHRVDTGQHRMRAVIMGLVCTAIMMWLFFVGKDYYLSDEATRLNNPGLTPFSALGWFGHTLGVAAGLLMLVNLTYFVRKEFRFMGGVGDIRTWMLLHVSSGLCAGALVLLHTALVQHNLFARTLYAGLGAVLVTGLIGRYFFSMVPLDPRGRPLTHAALVDLSRRMETEFQALFGKLEGTLELRRVLDLNGQVTTSLPRLLLRLFFVWPYRLLQLAVILFTARRQGGDGAIGSFRTYAKEMFRLRFQMDYTPGLKGLLASWRTLHAMVALLTVFLVAAHVVIEIWVGYGWMHQ